MRLRPIGHMPPSTLLTAEDPVGTGRQGAGSSRKEVWVAIKACPLTVMRLGTLALTYRGHVRSRSQPILPAKYERLTLGAMAFRRGLQMLQFCTALDSGGWILGGGQSSRLACPDGRRVLAGSH